MTKYKDTMSKTFKRDKLIKHNCKIHIDSSINKVMAESGYKPTGSASFALSDDQNGLDDGSAWIDFNHRDFDIDKGEMMDIIEGSGFELFEAPDDDGDQFMSTYGIPVRLLVELYPGDVIRTKDGIGYSVIDVQKYADGGPWKNKNIVTIVLVERVSSGTKKVFMKENEEQNVDKPFSLYVKNSSIPSGLNVREQIGSLYRLPRTEI